MSSHVNNWTVERVLSKAERRLKRLTRSDVSRQEADRARAMLAAIRKMQARLEEFDQTPLGSKELEAVSPIRPVSAKKRRAGSTRRPKCAA